MARTDIRGTDTLGSAQDSAKALVDPGADAIFPEATRDLSEFAAIRSAVDVPVLTTMPEFGKSELLTTVDLESGGVNMVIYPVTLLRSAMGTAERTLESIKADGSQQVAVTSMQTRARLHVLGRLRSVQPIRHLSVQLPGARRALTSSGSAESPQTKESRHD